MIDIRKLKELVRLMVANELTELDLRDSEEQVTLRRQHDQVGAFPAQQPAAVQMVAPAAGAAAAAIAAGSSKTDTAASDDPDAGTVSIDSPMVGTFYASANPDADAFVTVGSQVAVGAVVCLIEAMKIFNEIKAEQAGAIEKILVGNGESVEFGQPLFRLRPV